MSAARHQNMLDLLEAILIARITLSQFASTQATAESQKFGQVSDCMQSHPTFSLSFSDRAKICNVILCKNREECKKRNNEAANLLYHLLMYLSSSLRLAFASP